MKPFIPQIGLIQDFEIYAPGMPTMRFEILKPEIQNIQIELPKKFQGNTLSLAFRFHTPYQPYKYGLGKDDRSLALGLISVKLE